MTIYRRRLVLLGCLGVGILGGAIGPIFRIIYSEVYWPAIQFIEIFLIGSLASVLEAPYVSMNLAKGQTKYPTLGTFSSVVILIALLFPFYTLFEVKGIALAYATSKFGSLVVNMYGAKNVDRLYVGHGLMAVTASVMVWVPLYLSTLNLK